MIGHLWRRVVLAGLVALVFSSPSRAQIPSAPQPTSGAETHNHGGHGGQEPQKPKPAAGEDHSAHGKPADPKSRPADLPAITAEDRAAAFPKLAGRGHAVHDTATHYFVLFDRLEIQAGDGGAAASWDNRGWIGGDVDRFWFRTEGLAEDGDFATARAHALYGRAIHRWWDIVAGVRHDFEPGPARTWAAVGVQGLAPYFFEVSAVAYVGEAGRTQFRLETEYDLLLSNRLILQPLVQLEIHGKADPEHRIGAGLSSGELGVRVRYEIRREIAPYVGVTWHRAFFGTADRAKAAGHRTSGVRLAAGVRVWF
jgi:copper resistance protein B